MFKKNCFPIQKTNSSKFWELECCKQSFPEESRLSWSPNPERFILRIPEAVNEGDVLLNFSPGFGSFSVCGSVQIRI